MPTISLPSVKYGNGPVLYRVGLALRGCTTHIIRQTVVFNVGNVNVAPFVRLRATDATLHGITGLIRGVKGYKGSLTINV
jgi:hypothetical protein